MHGVPVNHTTWCHNSAILNLHCPRNLQSQNNYQGINIYFPKESKISDFDMVSMKEHKEYFQLLGCQVSVC